MKLIEAKCPYSEKAFEKLSGFKDSVIFSVFENITGKLYVDDENNPEIALACYRDFCFLSGTPCKVLNLDDILFSQCDNPVLIADNSLWTDFLGENTEYKRISRYKLKACEHFDTDKLKSFTAKIKDFPQLSMRIMNGKDYDSFNPDGWEHDMRGCYKSREDFCEKSFGVIISDCCEIICGATAYSYYSKGIEIQIETKKTYRNQGLATIAAAQLLLECEKRGAIPHWDAAHMQSARMAMKLGFEMVHEYAAYELKKRTNEN